MIEDNSTFDEVLEHFGLTEDDLNPAVEDIDVQAKAGWYRLRQESKAHLLVADNATKRLWRPLCQDSSVSAGLVMREATNYDDLCSNCRVVLGSRVSKAIAQRRFAEAERLSETSVPQEAQ